jgi:hypothetical protein
MCLGCLLPTETLDTMQTIALLQRAVDRCVTIKHNDMPPTRTRRYIREDASGCLLLHKVICGCWT